MTRVQYVYCEVHVVRELELLGKSHRSLVEKKLVYPDHIHVKTDLLLQRNVGLSVLKGTSVFLI